ncbi:MAG: TIGR00730 family Rossman fold protein [Bdellovibrionales bacterium]
MAPKSVCVYCGSSNHVNGAYMDLARDLGTYLGQKDIRLIYGGGHVGLMGEVADSCLKAGGAVTGIIPAHLHEREVQHNGLTELIVVDSMHERKSIMAERAEGFITLPGGFGTMDETFEILTWKQIGLHNKPIIIYNIDGFWDSLLELIQDMIDTSFAPKSNEHIFKAVTNQIELEAALNAPLDPLLNPEEKWK